MNICFNSNFKPTIFIYFYYFFLPFRFMDLIDKPFNTARPSSLYNRNKWCSKSWLIFFETQLPTNSHTATPSKQPIGTLNEHFLPVLLMVYLHWIIRFFLLALLNWYIHQILVICLANWMALISKFIGQQGGLSK